MAYEAKDGSKHSMASRMRAHNTSMDAKDSQTKPQEQILDQPSGEDEQPSPEAQQPEAQQPEQQQLSDPQQVSDAVQQVLAQVQQGQQPDPATAEALADYFGQFAQQQSEPDGDEGAPSEGM